MGRAFAYVLLAALACGACSGESAAVSGVDGSAETSPDGGKGGAGGVPSSTGGAAGAPGSGAGGITGIGGGGTSGSGGAAAGSGGATSPDAGTALGPYPDGPYGVEVGDVIANLALAGYPSADGTALSNTLAFDDEYSLQDLRATGAPYALIHVSAVYCPGCRNAARDLGTLGAGVLGAGGAVLEILSENRQRNTAARTDLDAWIETYDLRIPAFIDAAGSPEGAHLALGVRETTVIVEMPSMRVVYLDHGDTSGRTASSIGPAVTETLRLLGN